MKNALFYLSILVIAVAALWAVRLERRVAILEATKALTSPATTVLAAKPEAASHQYSLVEVGGRPWRLDAITGDTCLEGPAGTPAAKRASCDCHELFADNKIPEKALLDEFCR